MVPRPNTSTTNGTSATSGMFCATMAKGSMARARAGASTESAASTKATARPATRPSAAIGSVCAKAWPIAARAAAAPWPWKRNSTVCTGPGAMIGFSLLSQRPNDQSAKGSTKAAAISARRISRVRMLVAAKDGRRAARVTAEVVLARRRAGSRKMP